MWWKPGLGTGQNSVSSEWLPLTPTMSVSPDLFESLLRGDWRSKEFECGTWGRTTVQITCTFSHLCSSFGERGGISFHGLFRSTTHGVASTTEMYYFTVMEAKSLTEVLVAGWFLRAVRKIRFYASLRASGGLLVIFGVSWVVELCLRFHMACSWCVCLCPNIHLFVRTPVILK